MAFTNIAHKNELLVLAMENIEFSKPYQGNHLT